VVAVTRKDKVLRALQMARRSGFVVVPTVGKIGDTPDGWVDGWVLCHPGIGGSEGLRRLRELRADGVTIDKRFDPRANHTGYQYRLEY